MPLVNPLDAYRDYGDVSFTAMFLQCFVVLLLCCAVHLGYLFAKGQRQHALELAGPWVIASAGVALTWPMTIPFAMIVVLAGVVVVVANGAVWLYDRCIAAVRWLRRR